MLNLLQFQIIKIVAILFLLLAPLSGSFRVSAYDEAYAVVHVGMLGFNIDFFVAKICYKGETSYDFNVLQVLHSITTHLHPISMHHIPYNFIRVA